jgi:hypothetical protein
MGEGRRVVTTAGRGLLIAGLLLVSLARAGDPEVAAFLLKKAEKALRAKDYESAANDFRRAREEHTPLPAAAYGLGQALEKLGRESDALAAYRQCVAEAEGMDEPGFEERRAARRSASAIRRLRRRYEALDKATRAFVEDLLRFAKEYEKKAPHWAQRACETILRLDPSHHQAKVLLGKLQRKSEPKPETKPKPAKGWGSPLVEADDLPRWDPGIHPPWTCRDGLITADSEGPTGNINWLDSVSMEGRFEIRADVRVARDGGPKRTYGFFLGDGKQRWHGVLVEDDNGVVLIEMAGGGNSLLKDATPRGFDPAKWHTFRIVVDRGEIQVLLDDTRLFAHVDDNPRAFGGKFGLFSQNGRIEFRNLRWSKR